MEELQISRTDTYFTPPLFPIHIGQLKLYTRTAKAVEALQNFISIFHLRPTTKKTHALIHGSVSIAAIHSRRAILKSWFARTVHLSRSSLLATSFFK